MDSCLAPSTNATLLQWSLADSAGNDNYLWKHATLDEVASVLGRSLAVLLLCYPYLTDRGQSYGVRLLLVQHNQQHHRLP